MTSKVRESSPSKMSHRVAAKDRSDDSDVEEHNVIDVDPSVNIN